MHHDYDNTASGFQLSLPDGAVPVDTHPYNETIRVQQHNNAFPKNQAADQHHNLDTLQGHLQHLGNNWERILLQNFETIVSEEEFAQALTNKTLILATDGSVPDQVKASFGWILATTDGTRLAHCTGPAYGYSIASYRAEGYGLLSDRKSVV